MQLRLRNEIEKVLPRKFLQVLQGKVLLQIKRAEVRGTNPFYDSCDLRNDRIWRNAIGIRLSGTFHGYMLS